MNHPSIPVYLDPIDRQWVAYITAQREAAKFHDTNRYSPDATMLGSFAAVCYAKHYQIPYDQISLTIPKDAIDFIRNGRGVSVKGVKAGGKPRNLLVSSVVVDHAATFVLVEWLSPSLGLILGSATRDEVKSSRYVETGSPPYYLRDRALLSPLPSTV